MNYFQEYFHKDNSWVVRIKYFQSSLTLILTMFPCFSVKPSAIVLNFYLLIKKTNCDMYLLSGFHKIQQSACT